ncbi:MAG: hypothetical protein JJ966_14950 [Balneolaceae bacterium]|nr:hypothetical protein [Balneolaceae bacterium]
MPQKLQEIPSIFHNSETGAPIERCLMCDTYLLDDKEYIIEKAMVNYPGTGTTDLIWEFAMCMSCMDSVMSEYSKESHQAMNEYFMDNMDFARQRALIKSENFDPEEWMSSCMITGKPKNDCSQFQLTVQCKGDKAIFDRTPFLISDEAMDAVTELLSNATIDAMNKFRDEHFPPPEDLSPLLRDRDFVLI